MTNLAVKCGANGKAKVKGEVDGLVFVACRTRLATSGIPVNKFIEICMRSYAANEFHLIDGKVVFKDNVSRETSQTVNTEQHTRGKPGRPPKDASPDSGISPEENAKLPWHKQNPDIRRTEDYLPVVLPPLERDNAPNLYLSTKDENGKTWREYIEEAWFHFRIQIIDDEAWFDTTLWLLVHCAECKFRNEGLRNYRFRKNETAQEIIDLNQELTIKYSDKIDEALAIKKRKEEE